MVALSFHLWSSQIGRAGCILALNLSGPLASGNDEALPMYNLNVVLNTDRINRQNMMIPSSGLVGSIEAQSRSALADKLPLGVPSHVNHDLHRLVGWTTITGVHLGADMARQIGRVTQPETESEREALQKVVDAYWVAHHKRGVAEFEAQLRDRCAAVDLTAARAFREEAAVLRRPGLASDLFPQLFCADSDSDGLIDYRALLKRADEIQPGVFHDRKTDLLLFAHPFFRRSLSPRNALNTYFLADFALTAHAIPTLSARLRLDPDAVGHPASARHILELEYWRGPKFDPDIAAIPNGVTEHKANEHARYMQGIDRIEFWWKAEEVRRIDACDVAYRTLEAEELIENPSPGISAGDYGCRYVHAEYAADKAALTHFDGAIRAYDSEAYLTRIDLPIDRAGKRSSYTKLFRFDGPLPVDAWKSLTSNYFRGNPLVAEYFGMPEEPTTSPPEAAATSTSTLVPSLSAFVGFHPRDGVTDLVVIPEKAFSYGGAEQLGIEKPPGALGKALLGRFNLRATFLLEFGDDIINMPRIILGREATLAQDWLSLLDLFAPALEESQVAGEINRATFTFSLPAGDALLATISVAGEATLVIKLLDAMRSAIDPLKPAADWTPALQAAIEDLCPDGPAPRDPFQIIEPDGRLVITRPAAMVQLHVPTGSNEV